MAPSQERAGTPMSQAIAHERRGASYASPRPGRTEEGTMPDVSRPAEVVPEAPAALRVGWRFISLYALAYMSTCLVFLAPALVTLALKVNSLVGIDQAPTEPGAGHRHRRVGVDGRQPVLRPAERPHLVVVGDAAAVDAHRSRRRLVRHPRRGVGTRHRGRPRRLVHRPAALQRAAGRDGRRPAGPGPGRPARPGLRCAGRLPAHRRRDRHLPGPAVQRAPARDVPGPVRWSVASSSCCSPPR